MRRIPRSLVGALLLAAVAAAVPPAGAHSAAPATADPQTFLRSLAGQWQVVTEATLGPGQEPVRSEGRESARIVGNWLVAEKSAEARGQPYTAILTLGFAPAQERFIGTWIDSMQTHMWRYEGALDEAGQVLTLATEGPIMGDPNNIGMYRETIELVGPDQKVIRSMILGPDGEWFEFSRAEYRRVN